MINFLRKNWAVIILAVIGIIWVKNNLETSRGVATLSSSRADMALPMAAGGGGASSKIAFYNPEVAPSDSSERIVIQDTNLSLQVKDVAEVIKKVEETAKNAGGFLISSHLSKPESAASGNISVRVPEIKRAEVMAEYKKMAVKVVSESVYGTDVTDQYTDLQAQLEVLLKTKVKFQEILDKAYSVSDLLNVQRELISLQSQIDSVKGQQKYYEQSAKLSKIMVYLSTDELALPYAPTNEWRPTVIFKEAVRSLVGAVRGLGTLTIWLAVFSPIIIPTLLIIRYFKRKKISR